MVLSPNTCSGCGNADGEESERATGPGGTGAGGTDGADGADQKDHGGTGAGDDVDDEARANEHDGGELPAETDRDDVADDRTWAGGADTPVRRSRRPRDLPHLRPTRTANMVIDLPSLAGRTATDIEGIVATLDGRPLAVWAVEQLLCDSWIAAVVTDAKGAVIDATERTADFTETQRRLIAVRDRCCVPGM